MRGQLHRKSVCLVPMSAAGACMLVSGSILGQTSRDVTEEIVVEATRAEMAVSEIPAAVGVVDQTEIQLGRQQLGLDESVVKIPGIFLQNRYNFAQDLRVAIRGFGARGNFGIRGVKILVDGIPNTLPDGQGQIDSVDIGSAGRIDVLRGAVSSLYGNASGGVINITTEEPPEQPFAEGRAAWGEDGYQKFQVKAGASHERFDYLISASYLDYDGFRDHSQVENKLFNSRFRYHFDDSSELTAILNLFDSPTAEDPGGITAAQAAADPRQARDVNVRFNAGEAIDQQKIGLRYRKPVNDNHEFIIRGYSLWRDFDGRLPFTSGGSVTFDREFFGGGVQYNYNTVIGGMQNRLITGIDIDRQDDDRQRFDNNQGVKGVMTLDQNEKVTSIGVFLQNELDLTPRVTLTAGVRYDQIEFDVKDRFQQDGDDSGNRDLDEVSPMIGLLWRASDQIGIYANISTAFETPTTTEFANPSGGGGFNPDLDPQTATNYEIGLRGVAPGAKARYEIALFHIEVDDEITPFELPEFPGRTFFQNAGESTRDGIEAALVLQPLSGLTASLSYTYSSFEFDEFTVDGDSFAGKTIPGIPKHTIYGEVSYDHPSGVFAVGDVLYVGELFANNSNSVEVDAYTVANIRAGYRKSINDWEITPFVGVNNLFDEDYNANVRINAFGGRFFEPAPDRNAFGGVTVRKFF